jgi:hypothetical protein
VEPAEGPEPVPGAMPPAVPAATPAAGEAEVPAAAPEETAGLEATDKPLGRTSEATWLAPAGPPSPAHPRGNARAFDVPKQRCVQQSYGRVRDASHENAKAHELCQASTCCPNTHPHGVRQGHHPPLRLAWRARARTRAWGPAPLHPRPPHYRRSCVGRRGGGPSPRRLQPPPLRLLRRLSLQWRSNGKSAGGESHRLQSSARQALVCGAFAIARTRIRCHG